MPRSLRTLSKPPGTVSCGPVVPHLLASCLRTPYRPALWTTRIGCSAAFLCRRSLSRCSMLPTAVSRLCDTQLPLALYTCRQPHTPDTRWVSEQVPPLCVVPSVPPEPTARSWLLPDRGFPCCYGGSSVGTFKGCEQTCAPCCAAPKTIRPFPRSRFRRCTLPSQAMAVNPLVSS
ncbi:hypothetical protein C8R43DRAFT_991790 [Mycena crocata]|nr:hypothetical protein C8R43DRAFT_991790 [Mycena crocata]